MEIASAYKLGAGRKHREVEGVSMRFDPVMQASVPLRPLALVVQLPNRALSGTMPSPQTVFTGSERYLLDVLKRALGEILKVLALNRTTSVCARAVAKDVTSCVSIR